ncbi:hypothetical protein JW960_05760 [candidate division KSB1 bacterium]|nr:hypothetical protein [candidate division KSB1 bacterium]
MKRLTALTLFGLAFAVAALPLKAQDDTTPTDPVVHGPNFVDENGDGYNDLAPDSDGDGIPNGMDADYTPQNPDRTKRGGFIDEDGDGLNDRFQDADGDGIRNCEDPDWTALGSQRGQRGANKSGNANGRKGNGVRGSGNNGAGTGDGVCDGTGPKGKQGGKRGNK